MKFQAEIDLVETLKTSIKSVFRKSNIHIFEEVSVGYGIADIVISDLNDSSQTVNNDLRPAESLSLLDINIYSLVQNSNDLTIIDMVNITRCSKSTICKSVNKLANYGYILKDDSKFVINKAYEFPFRTNIAIEAKLKDWKRALKQAYRYKWFAEYSFVVLDTHHCQAAIKNIECFVKYNVGLASISTDGKLQRHFFPIRQKPFDMKMQMLFSEKVKSSVTQVGLPSA